METQSSLQLPSQSLQPIKLQWPHWCREVLFTPGWRYRAMHGGRGAGAKSWSVARALVVIASSRRTRILCTREFQLSISESVHKLLSDQIINLGLQQAWNITEKSMRCCNGSDVIFAGLRTNPAKIKSTEGVDICWVEEAEKVSAESWKILTPTIRKPGSEIWVTFNPDEESDPTSQRFISNPAPNMIVRKLSYKDNPYFPAELKAEMEWMYKVDPEAAAHVWGGEFRKVTKAQIFRGKYTVQDFVLQPGWHGPYYGADWGFAQDPTTLVECWINDEMTKLYIRAEAYGVGIELDDIAPFFVAKVPGCFNPKVELQYRPVIRGDCARPDTISHVRTAGLNVIAAEKWQGSVEDGITFLKRFEQIIIAPACKHTETEARLYQYKVDKLTDDVLPIVLDKHNHMWDAIRYALEPIIHFGDMYKLVTHEEDVHIAPEFDEAEYAINTGGIGSWG